jgi:hypothetical protein
MDRPVPSLHWKLEDDPPPVTWKQMPLCLQKPATLLEMAKVLHRRGETAAARELADRCAQLDEPDSAVEDHIVMMAFVAHIHHEIGDEQAAREVMTGLTLNPRVKQSVAAMQLAASELISFRLYAQAYALIQGITSPADRAVPLARLAEGMVKEMK